MARAQPRGKLHLEALSAQNFEAFARLLGGDEFGGCFCAVWTHHGSDWGKRCGDAAQPNRAATRADLDAGRRPGYLVFHDDEIVAWTGAGPKSEFPALSTRLGARVSTAGANAWCIGCLAIAEGWRGTRLPDRIVELVLEVARSAGASELEAYPTDPWDEPRSYRGALSLYQRHGFAEQARESDGTADIVLMSRALP